MVSFCLGNCLEGLVLVCAQGNLCDIDITIAHRHGSEILLLGLLAACSELCHSTFRSCLGGLSAGVGIDLGVEDEDVDILAGSKYVIESAVADIICPAVAAEDPLALLCQEISVLLYNLCLSGIIGSKGSKQLIGSSTVGGAVILCIQPLLCSSVSALCKNLCRVSNLCADRILCKEHTKAELCVVLEQRIAPCRTMSLRIHGVRRGR